MNPPDESIFHFIKDWLWAPLLAFIAWGWNFHMKMVDDLKTYVDKQDDDQRKYVDEQDTEIKFEVNRQRDVSAKIFDKLDDHARRSEDRHHEILKALHEGLSRKVDK
ncbi:MAG: hypothetical protein ACXWJZ_01220 [Burkholderiaceae bacterium]